MTNYDILKFELKIILHSNIEILIIIITLYSANVPVYIARCDFDYNGIHNDHRTLAADLQTILNTFCYPKIVDSESNSIYMYYQTSMDYTFNAGYIIVHFCSDWNIEGYGTGASRDLWD